jgi:hypothetical protein
MPRINRTASRGQQRAGEPGTAGVKSTVLEVTAPGQLRKTDARDEQGENGLELISGKTGSRSLMVGRHVDNPLYFAASDFFFFPENWISIANNDWPLLAISMTTRSPTWGRDLVGSPFER